MNKVTLYYEERPDIRITVDLYFEEGKLILDGYDWGNGRRILGGISITNTLVR